jgi:hypothetical protein
LSIFPNPVNSLASIAYDLDEPSSVEIVIYNQLGQVVSKLYDGAKPAGKQLVSYDMSGLPAGVYYCRLSMVDGRWSMCRKIVKY